MRKAISILVGLVLLSGFAATLYYLYSKSDEPPVVHPTKTAFRTDIVKKTVATGAVVPRKEVSIKPQVSGIVEAILVEPGRQVRRGDLIARIRIIPNSVAQAAAENRVNVAVIGLDDAQREHERHRRLFDDGVIPESLLRQHALALERAREELTAAKDALEIVRKGTTVRRGSSSNTLVRATIDGTVLEVPVEEGHSVIEANTFNEGTTIATVADMSQLVFEGKVDESEVGKIRPGMPLVLTIGAIEGETFDATLEHIAPKGIEQEGAIQFEIRAAITPRKGSLIRANYSANADIVLDRRQDVLAIEEGLLSFEGDRTFVEVETAPQRFQKREVETGLSDGINVEIVKGLTAKDRIKAAAPPEEAPES